jgi:tetratricopeptide (TPR) repeat protein
MRPCPILKTRSKLKRCFKRRSPKNQGKGGTLTSPATMKLRQQDLISKNSLAGMIQSANELWSNRDYQQSIKLMERASRLDPANAGILLNLGLGHGVCYDYAAAERCFEKAVRVATRKAEVLAMAGQHCLHFNRHEMARHYLERAIKEPHASPDSFIRLAEIYEHFHRLEEASQLSERALQIDSHHAMALCVRARLKRLTGQLEEAEKLLRPLLAQSDQRTLYARIRSSYELGTIFDLQGRYDDAMAAFLEAKAMMRPNAAQCIAAQRAVHARLKLAETNISAEVLGRWFKVDEEVPNQRRLTLLCGHPRSGTTLLEQVLDSHPDITSAEETNTFFFSAEEAKVFYNTCLPTKRSLPDDASVLSVLESASPGACQQAREYYFRRMEIAIGNPIGDRLLIDKNPSLTALVPAFVRIFPEAKFLVMIRDPRDVCLSCFMQPLPLSQISAMFLSLEDTVQEYTSVMGFWRAIAPRMQNPRMEVRYEDMVENLESVSHRTLEFLGISWDSSVMNFNEFVRQKLVRSPTSADVAKPIFKSSVGRWRNYQKYIDPWQEKLAPLVKAFGYE